MQRARNSSYRTCHIAQEGKVCTKPVFLFYYVKGSIFVIVPFKRKIYFPDTLFFHLLLVKENFCDVFVWVCLWGQSSRSEWNSWLGRFVVPLVRQSLLSYCLWAPRSNLISVNHPPPQSLTASIVMAKNHHSLKFCCIHMWILIHVMALVLHFNKGTYSLFFCPFTCKVVLW